MFVPLDRDAAAPLPRQISAYLEELIRRGHLEAGAPLPPTRSLARDLGVNRKTVEAAYDELAARRLVDVRAGRGAVVRRRLPDNPALDLPFRPSRARDPFPPEAWLAPEHEPPPTADFAGLGPRVTNVSSRQLRLFHDEALAPRRSPLFSPPPPLGDPGLRRAAARHLARCGVLREPDEIVVFPDRAAAVAAVLRLFVPARGLVLLDGPVDPDLGRPLRERGARVSVLPATPAAFARAGGRATARLIVAATGASRLPGTPPDPVRRRSLLDLARDRAVPILEDVTGLDLASPPQAPPLATLDGTGRVLPLCDLSDEAGGGFSAAILAATPKALDRLRIAGPAAEPPDRLAQQVIARALDSPRRTRTLEAVRERRRLLLTAISRTIGRRLPEIANLEFTPAGDAVRIDLPDDLPAAVLARAAEARGVRVIVPHECGLPPSRDDFLLLDLTRHEEGELLDGIRRLGEALDSLEEDDYST